jgi:NAD(P)-dependent dehydrogenase (short-subunit alcohol dehydrogenase family)
MRPIAFIVGADGGPGAALKELARQVGFGQVYNYTSVERAEAEAPAVPLAYFLFAGVTRPARMKPVAQSIRQSAEPRIRFAPLIYFSETPSLDAIRACIAMGFDDVITLPFTLARVEERLERQCGRTLVYYETATYFGPDRRDRLENEEGHSDRGSGGQYRRMEIMRSTSTGISVSDDTHVVI